MDREAQEVNDGEMQCATHRNWNTIWHNPAQQYISIVVDLYVCSQEGKDKLL